MGTRMSRPSYDERRTRTMEWRGQLQQRVYTATLRTVGPRLHVVNRKVSRSQKNLVLTAFMLGIFSIVTCVFPICAIPVGLAGVCIGFSTRRIQPLASVAMWAMALSVIGLVLSIVFAIVSVSFYYGRFLWG